MVKQSILVAVAAFFLFSAIACNSSRSVTQDLTIRIYLGFGGTVTDDNQQEVQHLLAKSMDPQGPLSKVPDVLDVDTLSPELYVVHSGKLSRQSHARRLTKQILLSLKERSREEDLDALQTGLTRTLYLLKQSNESTRVYAVIVSKGLTSNVNSAKLQELIKQIQPYRVRLGSLCILGVDGSVLQPTAQLFSDIRDKATVRSLSRENIQSCLPSL